MCICTTGVERSASEEGRRRLRKVSTFIYSCIHSPDVVARMSCVRLVELAREYHEEDVRGQ